MSYFLDPVPEDVFFQEHWQKNSCLSLQSPNKELFSKLVTLNDIENFISSIGGSKNDWIDLVKPSSFLKKDIYSNSNSISLPQVYQAYNQGYTLLLTKVHKKIPLVADLCREYEKIFFKYKVLYLRKSRLIDINPQGIIWFSYSL